MSLPRPERGRGDGGDSDAFRWAQGLAREPARQRVFVGAVAALVLLSIPFYWSWLGADGLRWLGLPAWIWGTLGCSCAISGVTAWAATRHWRDGDVERGP